MHKIKWVISILCMLATGFTAFAQQDTNYLKSIYDRCLDFDESKRDSLLHYAHYIEKRATELNFIPGKVLSLRLKGIHAELSEEYDQAASLYLLTLAEARRLENRDYESAAISDLSILYSHIKQPVKAMEMFRLSAQFSKERGEIGGLFTSYINMGAIHNQLNHYDSALLYLNQAKKIAYNAGVPIELSTLFNNLGNVYYQLKKYDSALYYFRSNLVQHTRDKDESGLWIAYLNMADVFIEQERFDSAHHYAELSLKTGIKLNSRGKEADSYAILAKLYERKNSYPEAYTYLQKWYSLDTSLVNSETTRRVADLQEKYNAQKRENDNRLLMADLTANKVRQRAFALSALALLIIALLTGFAFITKRKANKLLSKTNNLILEKNERLAQLNQEKNALISIVSHDLSSPFVNIMMWGQLMQINNDNLNSEQKTAVERMLTSATKGEQLIRTILDVEKAETNNHLISFERTEIDVLIRKVMEQYSARAAAKNIEMKFSASGNQFTLLTDAHLVERIMENLLSNAIKFSNKNTSVYIHLHQEQHLPLSISIRDEGVGIPQEELPHLFTKYSRISSTPTNGEASTGLGLSIVKRIVDELNGSIVCHSQEGVGTEFRVEI